MSSQAENVQPVATGEVVYASAFFRDDSAFVAALQNGRRTAQAILIQENAEQVAGWLQRILGTGKDLRPLIEAGFHEAMARVPARGHSSVPLNDWLLKITVGVAIKHLRRERWAARLGVKPPALAASAEPTASPKSGASHSGAAHLGTPHAVAMQRIYGVLETMPILHRVVFTLRFFAQLELNEIASACGISATRARQCLVRSRSSFVARVHDDPALQTVLQGWARS